jgi:hypothetical protein
VNIRQRYSRSVSKIELINSDSKFSNSDVKYIIQTRFLVQITISGQGALMSSDIVDLSGEFKAR